MSDMNLFQASPARAGNSLLASLSPLEAELMAPFLQDVALSRDLTLYEAVDPIDYVYFPHDAVVSRVAPSPDGEGILTAVTGREAACGIGVALDRPRAIATAEVLIGGRAARIAAADFQAACLKSPVLRGVTARCLTLLMNQLHHSATCHAHHSLEGRISRWLLECNDRVGNELQLTQGTLARMLGVLRTSVTLVTCSLSASGAIEYSAGTIRIADRKALEASACECYRSVRRWGRPPCDALPHAS